MPPDTHPQHPPAVHAPIAPSVARVDTAPLTVPSADRLRRRLAVHLAGVLAAALATRALAEVLPMEIAAGWGALVAIGLPGWAAVRLLRLDRRLGTAEAVALAPLGGIAAWAPPLALAFLTGLPFVAVLIVVLVASAVGLALCEPFRPELVERREAAGMGLAALLAGAVGWYYQGGIGAGDALFHAGRVRKLIELDSLSLSGISTYLDGAPHAGYAFPLLHAAQAGAVKLAGGDPSATYVSLVPVFVCLVPVAVYAAGRAIAGPAVGAAAALLACWDALVPGAWPLSLQWTEQPPTFTFVVLLPIGVLVIHELCRTPEHRGLQASWLAIVGVVAFVHPTYVFPLLAIGTGVLLVSWVGLRTLLASYALGAAILGWIWWQALAGAPPAGAFNPTYRSGVGKVFSHTVMLSGQAILAHRGAFLIAMLAIPVLLIGFGRRYALAAVTMLGPFVLVALPGALALLIPIVNLAQARRFWIAVPWPYVAALVLALVAARFPGRRLAIPAAAAVVLSFLFHLRFKPLWNTYATELCALVAVAGLGIALWLIVTRRRVRAVPHLAAGALPVLLLAVGLLAVPALGHDYSRKPATGRPGVSRQAIDYLRAHDQAPFPVVLADLRPAYTLSGEAAVYVVAVNEGHMRAEPKLDPPARRAAVDRFLDPATSDEARNAVLDRYHVRYVMVERDSEISARLASDPRLQQVFVDGDDTPAVKRTIFRVLPQAPGR